MPLSAIPITSTGQVFWPSQNLPALYGGPRLPATLPSPLPSPLPNPPNSLLSQLRGQRLFGNTGALGAEESVIPMGQGAASFAHLPAPPGALSSSMPADNLFANSLGRAVGSGGAADSLGLVTGAGKGAFLKSLPTAAGSVGRFAAPALGVAGAGQLEQMAGKATGVQPLQAAGITSTLAAPAALLPSVAALPLAIAAAAGGALGDIGSNYLANPLRRFAGDEQLTNAHVSNLTDPGGALSWMPVVGGGELKDPAFAGGRDLTAHGMQAKFDSFGLQGEARTRAKDAFNSAITQARAGGANPADAAAAAWDHFYAPQTVKDKDGADKLDKDGKPILGMSRMEAFAGQAQNEDTAAAAQSASEQDQIRRAVAMQALVAQIAPEIMGNQSAGLDQYNAMMPGVINGMSGDMKAWAQKSQADNNLQASNQQAQTAQFFNALPQMAAYTQVRNNEVAAAKTQAELDKLKTEQAIREQAKSSGTGLSDLTGDSSK